MTEEETCDLLGSTISSLIDYGRLLDLHNIKYSTVAHLPRDVVTEYLSTSALHPLAYIQTNYPEYLI